MPCIHAFETELWAVITTVGILAVINVFWLISSQQSKAKTAIVWLHNESKRNRASEVWAEKNGLWVINTVDLQLQHLGLGW